jgi:hypothetical protein
MVSENTALTFAPIDEPMDPQATQADSQSHRGAPMRFSYATGSRPLAGYTIKRGIGRGGFGEVYFAVSDGGKEVALKLIRHNLDVELRGVTHCLNLKHANLIALYDVKQDEHDNSWVVMEYATGESLEEVIRRNPNGLHPEEAFEWMQGIAAGVGYLHDHGIVHRDLKPGNIFRDDGQVKLGDYGLSKFISCSRRSGQTESIGTVHYMAPEVANGRYGKEIDIYALGIILYEMLTGHVPFEGESVGEVLMKHLTAEPTLAEIPEGYRHVIGRALAKDPATRFASVAEMFAALPPLAATMAYRPPLSETRAAAEPAAHATQNQSAPPPPGGNAAGYAGAAAAGAAAAGAAATVQATLADEEPIWRAIRDGWRTTRDSWDSFNTPTKVGLAVLGIMVMSNSATWSFALNYLPPLILLYLLYRVGRSVVLNQERKRRLAREAGTAAAGGYQRAAYRPDGGPGPPPRPPSPPATEYRPQIANVPPGDWRSASARHWKKKHRGGKYRWREQAAAALVVKPPRQRATDLLGSMIMSAIVGAAITFVAMLFHGGLDQGHFAWLLIVSVAGSWAILIPAKIWEGRQGDQTVRRFCMLLAGLAVGGVAYGAGQVLMVDLPDMSRHGVHIKQFESFYNVNGSPLWQAYVAYFAILFPVLRWWRQADPVRSTRLSVWSTAFCVFVAWAISQFVYFPQPWGLMVAAIMSTSVQLVSPYVPHDQRLARPRGEEA